MDGSVIGTGKGTASVLYLREEDAQRVRFIPAEWSHLKYNIHTSILHKLCSPSIYGTKLSARHGPFPEFWEEF